MAAVVLAKAMTDYDFPGRFASPPCLAGELDADLFGLSVKDPQQALDVARWRKAQRTENLAQRAALALAIREEIGTQIGAHLVGFISSRFGSLAGHVISGYWPIKSEPDLRATLAQLHEMGARLALPVVEEREKPLVFRAWSPDAKMVRGFWNIPVPATSETLAPTIVLAPLVGWDDAGYRLGYGGGYFDRTLALHGAPPFAIGVGLQSAKLVTIFPQPHDIALGAIITESGLQWSAP